MAKFNPELRGLPPTRPLPSQVMHLLELSQLNIETAAMALHQPDTNLDKWMTFNTKDVMPPGLWLLLNLYTLAVKDVCCPAPMREFIRDRFAGAFPENITPKKRTYIPDKPPLPTSESIIDMLYDADATLEDLTYTQKSVVNSWLGPDMRPMPYANYELAVMTLWAQGKYTPTKDMADYIQEKYNGMFRPKSRSV